MHNLVLLSTFFCGIIPIISMGLPRERLQQRSVSMFFKGLFKPYWMKKYEATNEYLSKLDRVIDKIDSQIKLAEVVEKAPYYGAVDRALKKLVDQNLLEDLIRKPLGGTRLKIVSKLTKQGLLEELACNDDNHEVRLKAADTLIDRDLADKVYADLVTSNNHNGNEYFRALAFDKIENKKLKNEIEVTSYYQIIKRHIKIESDDRRDRIAKEAERMKIIENRRKEGRCPHCGVRLTGHPAYSILKDDPSYRFTCGACGRAI
jgi:ribosomal protein S27AE